MQHIYFLIPQQLSCQEKVESFLIQIMSNLYETFPSLKNIAVLNGHDQIPIIEPF